MSDSTRYVWLRLGDHRAELERAVMACTSEHSGRSVGDPSVSASTDSTGQKFTSLEAAGAWWLAYMRVHGGDWVGPATTDMVRDLLHPRPPLGDAR